MNCSVNDSISRDTLPCSDSAIFASTDRMSISSGVPSKRSRSFRAMEKVKTSRCVSSTGASLNVGSVRRKPFLPPERVQVLYSWKHSGFNVHAAERISPEAKADLENLAQYILRNPFSVEKMTVESPTDMVIYRSRLNANKWHVDPLRCPVCQSPMRVIAVIDDRKVTEKILRHLGAWHDPPPRPPTPGTAGVYSYEPCNDVDPTPDYENVLTD